MANKKITSERFHMEAADWKKFGEEALTKLTPYLLVLIPVMISELPPEATYTVVLVFLLQRLQSLLVLWASRRVVNK